MAIISIIVGGSDAIKGVLRKYPQGINGVRLVDPCQEKVPENENCVVVMSTGRVMKIKLDYPTVAVDSVSDLDVLANIIKREEK